MTTETLSGGASQTSEEVSDQATITGGEAQTDTVGKSTDQGTQQQTAEKVIPESYELTAPEGIELPADYIEQAKEVAKNYGLTQEQAQGLVERDAKLIGSFRAAEIERHNSQVQAWGDEIKADKDLGGERFDKTVQLARDAVARFGDDQLKTLLNESGYGNHPAVVRLFAKIGASIAEDNRPPGGGANPGQQRSAADILYPSTSQE